MKKIKFIVPLILSMVFLFSSTLLVYSASCHDCGGDGKVTVYVDSTKDCSLCNGNGQIWQDKVTDTHDCSFCEDGDVSTYKDCSVCYGSGQKYQSAVTTTENCSSCDNGTVLIYTDCSNCGADGKINCSNCNGSGQVYLQEQSRYDDCSNCVDGVKNISNSCTVCSGTGEVSVSTPTLNTCPWCSGSGSIYQSARYFNEDCSNCVDGVKKTLTSCPTCNASGYVSSSGIGAGAGAQAGVSTGIQCTYCGGDGKYFEEEPCTVCNSSGMIPVLVSEAGYYDCSHCNKTGKVTVYVDEVVNCTECGGDGSVSSSVACSSCDNGLIKVITRNAGYYTCSTCSGNKTVNCPACYEASGQIVNSDICSNCSGTGSVTVTVREAGYISCSWCSGTGQVLSISTCSNCSGLGVITTTVSEAGYISCSWCSGTGQVETQVSNIIDCDTCGGTGDIEEESTSAEDETTSSGIGAGGAGQGGIDAGLDGFEDETTSSGIGAGGAGQGSVDSGLDGFEEETSSSGSSASGGSSSNIISAPLELIINFVNWVSDWFLNFFDNLQEFVVKWFVPSFNPITDFLELLNQKIPIAHQMYILVGGFIQICDNFDYTDYEPYIPINFDLGRDNDLTQSGVLMYKCNNCGLIMTIEKYTNNNSFCTCGSADVSDYYFNSGVVNGAEISVSLGVSIPNYYQGIYNTLDVSWYAPYRDTVNSLLSVFLWLGFGFSVIKSIPKLIGGI